jgi:uncharacterized protein with PIN domain
MIVIDTSARVAINHEPERTEFFEVIAASDRRLVSAAR